MPSRELTDLSPTEFENFVFDLIRASGMRNLVWRTPGPDGGRDLEGDHVEYDFAGSFFLEKWFIEAKRYQSAVDWPTVWGKISYAQNADAQFLLMVTTSTFSPKCVDEIEKWNQNRRHPKIRCWPRAELQHRVKLLPTVGIKYGLLEASDKLVPALTPLSRHLAKCTMAGQEAFSASGTPGNYLECAAALAELLLVRSEDINLLGRIAPRKPVSGEPWYQWLTLTPPKVLNDVDTPSVRALACAIKLVAGASGVRASQMENSGVELSAIEPEYSDLDTGTELIDSILLWGDLEASVKETSISIWSRKRNM